MSHYPLRLIGRQEELEESNERARALYEALNAIVGEDREHRDADAIWRTWTPEPDDHNAAVAALERYESETK